MLETVLDLFYRFLVKTQSIMRLSSESSANSIEGRLAVLMVVCACMRISPLEISYFFDFQMFALNSITFHIFINIEINE